MRKALIVRFLSVLMLALIMSSAVAYYFYAENMLKSNISAMRNVIQAVDFGIDYSENLQEQVQQLAKNTDKDENHSKLRITLIALDGTVLADSEATDITIMDNHLEREEIRMALNSEYGFAVRYSDTLKINMLYVASTSSEGNVIIRMAEEFTGLEEYFTTIFPFLLGGMALAFLVSLILTYRFTNTITKPLHEISDQMAKARGNELEFSFRHYKYEELNIISDTTLKLTAEIRDYFKKNEFEKNIRQEFFSNASHELKTPITSIRGYAELLDQGFVKDEETKKDFITRILRETENMTGLINDILMISRLETKDAQVSFSRVRMSPLVNEIFESLEPIASEYGVKLHQECEPIIIEASIKQLRELIMNLVSNGIKYNKPGGDVWVSISKKAENMELLVRDNGMGISKDDQQRVFGRFYRVDKGRSKRSGGTGLGLSIVKHIVEFYEGEITLESELGKGSTFKILIPFERKQQETDES